MLKSQNPTAFADAGDLQQTRILTNEAVLKFIGIPMDGIPAEFGLRAFPGKTFRVGPYSYRNDQGIWMYYLEVQTADGWVTFAKGTRSELFHELVRF